MKIPFIYKIGVNSYNAVIKIASIFNSKANDRVKGYSSTFDKLKQFNAQFTVKKRVWYHASSVGEYEQCIPVIKELKDLYPSYQTILTVYSPSLYNYLDKKERASKLDLVIYLPPDNERNASSLVKLINPTIVVWSKYDFWFYHMHAIASTTDKFYLISSVFRKDQLFFKNWATNWLSMLRAFSYIFVQDEVSYKLLKDNGITQVKQVGDTRLDRVINRKKEIQLPAKILKFKSDNDLFVMASVHASDKKVIQKAVKTSGLEKILIVPHDLNEVFLKYLDELPSSCRWSKRNDVSNKRIMILDTIGLLFDSYSLADGVYIGGGFGKGVHNILEPLVFLLPIWIGPNYHKFKEAVELIGLGLIKEIAFDQPINTELNIDPKSIKSYLEEHSGATQSIIAHIKASLN